MCACVGACVCVVRKHREEQASDVRQSNEAKRQRMSKLEGEIAPFD